MYQRRDDRHRLAGMFILAMSLFTVVPAFAQAPLGTSFTMQGLLENHGQAVNGPVDFVFEAFDGSDPATSTFLQAFSRDSVGLDRGLFTVEIDFPANIFTGDEVWILTSVRRPGEASFTDLMPLQKMTAAPYALHALNSANADHADHADQLDGFDSSAFLRITGGTVSGSLDATGDVGASTLTLNGSTISNWSEISGGGGGQADNLGNHMAEQTLQMGSHYIDFTTSYGIRSTNGARIETGPEGQTFQFWPGNKVHGDAHSAIFRDTNGQPNVVIDKNGKLGIGIFQPQVPLDVAGDAQISSTLTAGSITTNTLTATNIVVGGQCFRPRPLVRCWLPAVTNHLTWVDSQQECLNAGGTPEAEILILARC